MASASAPPPPAPPPAPAPPPRAAVEIEASDAASVWFASGLEEMTKRELLARGNVDVAPKLDHDRCPMREPKCIVEQHRADGASVVLLGRVDRRAVLSYTIYGPDRDARPLEGALELAAEPTPVVERRLGQMLRPAVQRGGMLDRAASAPAPASIPAAPEKPEKKPKATGATPAQDRAFFLAVLGAIALVTSPLVLALLLVGARELTRRARPASWKWSGLLLAVLAPLPVAQRVFDVRAALASPADGAIGAAAVFATGALWGSFLLVLGAWIFASIQGFARVRAEALWALLRSWLTLAALRAAALALVQAPIVWTAWRTAEALALPRGATLAVVVPCAGLLGHFWLLSLVDNLSLYLDAALVVGPATERNPWHATIRRYFRGYLRRNGVDVAPDLFARALLLPSRRADVVAYGGGFARPRILVGERPREVALGELPDEEELPERTVNAEELPCGLIAPSPRVREDAAELARAEQHRRAATAAPARPRAPMPRLLGAHATLLGAIAPNPEDAGLPLIANTEDDFGVVKRLLTEHYAAFEGNVDGDEVDDTDPSQKDFLFGALLREVGVVARRDVLFATIALAVDTVLAKTPRLHRVVVGGPRALYARLFAAPAAKVGDAYAALNTGFHHLIQYLCFVRGTDETLLTARANEPQMVRTSHAMLARIESEEPQASDRHATLDATTRARIAWLARFFHAPLAPRRVAWVRVLSTVLLLVVAGLVVGRWVRDAIAYHPTYVARIKAQAARATEGDNAP